MNLYEVAEEIEKAFALAVDPDTGEIDEEKMVLLENLQMERDRKIENVACYIKNLKADAAALKAEKDAFQKRQKQAENKAEALSRYLMDALNGEKFSSNRCSVSFRHTTKVALDEGVTIYDIDTHFVRMKEPELDKTAIKKALEDGNTIAGVHMEDGLSMTIR